MTTRLRHVLLAFIVLMAAGCCAPKELFSGIDRHCFVADWCNEHSCVNRACYKHARHQRFRHQSGCETCRQPLVMQVVQPGDDTAAAAPASTSLAPAEL
jgi:hypothetical protein